MSNNKKPCCLVAQAQCWHHMLKRSLLPMPEKHPGEGRSLTSLEATSPLQGGRGSLCQGTSYPPGHGHSGSGCRNSCWVSEAVTCAGVGLVWCVFWRGVPWPDCLPVNLENEFPGPAGSPSAPGRLGKRGRPSALPFCAWQQGLFSSLVFWHSALMVLFQPRALTSPRN